jgi:uncharacterized membrane protein
MSDRMTNDTRILYCGDTALRGAASYLAGVMSHFSIAFDYLASNQPFTDEVLFRDYGGIILSDYSAINFSPGQLVNLTEKVRQGMGLLMIGGWASFTGTNGEYVDTVLRDLLPVVMQRQDDRVNSWQPCLIEKTQEHAIVDALPFDELSPSVGGFNRFKAKPGASTILTVRQIEISRKEGKVVFSPSSTCDPLLVLGRFGLGRVAAFAGDVAPHWVGGLVDWGDSRILAQAEGANQIEVGNWYAGFFGSLIRWITVGSGIGPNAGLAGRTS